MVQLCQLQFEMLISLYLNYIVDAWHLYPLEFLFQSLPTKIQTVDILTEYQKGHVQVGLMDKRGLDGLSEVSSKLRKTRFKHVLTKIKK